MRLYPMTSQLLQEVIRLVRLMLMHLFVIRHIRRKKHVRARFSERPSGGCADAYSAACARDDGGFTS